MKTIIAIMLVLALGSCTTHRKTIKTNNEPPHKIEWVE